MDHMSTISHFVNSHSDITDQVVLWQNQWYSNYNTKSQRGQTTVLISSDRLDNRVLICLYILTDSALIPSTTAPTYYLNISWHDTSWHIHSEPHKRHCIRNYFYKYLKHTNNQPNLIVKGFSFVNWYRATWVFCVIGNGIAIII